MNRYTVKKGILLSAIALLGTISMNAQSKERKPQKPPTYEQLLKGMDANKDGKLSEKEIKGPLKEDFAKVDTNKDGFITKEEFEKAPKPKRGKLQNN